MRWNKASIKTSIYNLLGVDAPVVAVKPTVNVELKTSTVRSAMLGSLGANGREIHPNIHRKIRFANDVHGLWYCRSELMAVLADVHGEAAARATIGYITELFQGLLPDSLLSRNSPASKRRN
jgi:hypothetical protein